MASNPANWQRTAGSAADAAPVFACSIRSCGARSSIPDGGYVRDWVPELAQPPAGVIHQPWTATPLGPAGARVELGNSYPEPITNHRKGRGRAQAYAKVRGA